MNYSTKFAISLSDHWSDRFDRASTILHLDGLGICLLACAFNWDNFFRFYCITNRSVVSVQACDNIKIELIKKQLKDTDYDGQPIDKCN